MRSLYSGGLAIAAAMLSSVGGQPIGFRRGPTPNRYRPHIGAKQRGKYQPNMPLHITGWQRRAELEAWNAEMDRKYGRNQEAPAAMAA